MSTPDDQGAPPSLPQDRAPDFAEIARWARSMADPGVFAEIHPDDDMLRFVRDHGLSTTSAWSDYFWQGKEATWILGQLLEWSGRSWGDIGACLDFASGYGRGARYLVERLPRESLVVSDILASAVAYQKEHLGVQGFVSDVDPDRVSFDRSFDLIQVISLFSHLPQETFRAWLAKLTGALAPSGLLLFTTHGIDLAGSEQESSEFVFRTESESAILDRETYGSMFVSPQFVERMLAEFAGVELIAHLPAFLNGHQDIYVVGRDVTPPATAFTPRPHARLQFDIGVINDRFEVYLEGWAVDGTFQAVPSVRIWLDGHAVGEAVPDMERPDVAEGLGPQTASKVGWSFALNTQGRRPRWAVAMVETVDSTEVALIELSDRAS